MQRQTETPPAIASAPAPWQLAGAGYIVVLWLPDDFLDHHCFLPPEQAGSRKGRFAYLMFVDYVASPVGPYHELLFIPGSIDLAGERCLTISRIFVSSWESVVNGRANWGIPKDRCDFAVSYGADGIDRITLIRDNRPIVELTFKAYGFRLPVTTALLPQRWRMLGQTLAGRHYFYTPAARGHIRPARLLAARIDGEQFPDFRGGKVLATFRVSDFQMTFPAAR